MRSGYDRREVHGCLSAVGRSVQGFFSRHRRSDSALAGTGLESGRMRKEAAEANTTKPGVAVRYVILAFALPLATLAQKRPVTLDDVTATRAPRSGSGAIHWSPDGKRFAFRDGNSIWQYDV